MSSGDPERERERQSCRLENNRLRKFSAHLSICYPSCPFIQYTGAPTLFPACSGSGEIRSLRPASTFEKLGMGPKRGENSTRNPAHRGCGPKDGGA